MTPRTYAIARSYAAAFLLPSPALAQQCYLPIDKRPIRDIPACVAADLKRVAADPGAASITDVLGAGVWVVAAGVIGLVVLAMVAGIIGAAAGSESRGLDAERRRLEARRQAQSAARAAPVAPAPTAETSQAFRLGQMVRRLGSRR